MYSNRSRYRLRNKFTHQWIPHRKHISYKDHPAIAALGKIAVYCEKHMKHKYTLWAEFRVLVC
jgi:hypothetical protein